MSAPVVRQFGCDACGAGVIYDAGSGLLRCPSCGTGRAIPVLPAPPPVPLGGSAAALRPEGWGLARHTLLCGKCGGSTSFDAGQSAGRCAFCGSVQVADTPADPTVPRPPSLAPFRVTREAAADALRGTLKIAWMAPNNLEKEAVLGRLQGVYVPFYLFTATARGRWSGESRGGRKGGFWTRHEGEILRTFRDLPLPASRGFEPKDVRNVEPFSPEALVGYDAAWLAGFLAEENGLTHPEAWEAAQERIRKSLEGEAREQMPGDEKRGITVDIALSDVESVNALLPLWVSVYRYRDKPYRSLVNGLTGTAWSDTPVSAVKMAILIAFLLFMVWLVN